MEKPQLKAYLYSVSAIKRLPSNTQVSARAIVVLAANQDEALGKAIRLGRESLPPSDGWIEHEATGAIVKDETVRAWAIAYGFVES